TSATIGLALLLAGFGVFARRKSPGAARGILIFVLLVPLGLGTAWLCAQTRAHALNETQVLTTASGLAYSRVTQTFNGTVTIKNVSRATIEGPFHIVMNSPAMESPAGKSLPGRPAAERSGGVALANATGDFGGLPYVTVPGIGSLAPGQSATVPVRFRNPSRSRINFTPVTYSGNLK
ncbi:MAG TPA: hypothetical protein VGS58_01880, partial [Candidatus Sulfopaludibacter sp.]|nr:hypothetical protein [Candidatus Sulfopaludibacter sp.]